MQLILKLRGKLPQEYQLKGNLSARNHRGERKQCEHGPIVAFFGGYVPPKEVIQYVHFIAETEIGNRLVL